MAQKIFISILLIVLLVSCEKVDVVSPVEVSGHTQIALNLTASAHVEVHIENRFNTVIRHLNYGQIEPGYHELDWDNLDDEGEHLLPGQYFIRLSLDGEEYTRTQQISIWPGW